MLGCDWKVFCFIEVGNLQTCVGKLVKWFRFCDNALCFYSKDIPLSQYTAEQKQNGKWGSTLDMCFVSIAFGVNIVSISNTTGGLRHFSVYDYFRTLDSTCNYILDGVPTIWIYHHLYKQPFMPSVMLNHFCCLSPASGLAKPIYKEQTVDHNKRKINTDDTVKTKPRKKTKISAPTTAGHWRIQQRSFVILMSMYLQPRTKD